MIVCIAHAKVGYRQAIHSEKPDLRKGVGLFLLAAAILSFLIIAATGTGDAIAKGHGTYMPMVRLPIVRSAHRIVNGT